MHADKKMEELMKEHAGITTIRGALLLNMKLLWLIFQKIVMLVINSIVLLILKCVYFLTKDKDA
jgi:hypothetical protein